MSLFIPGQTCWRVERADRFATLVDGEAYFSAVRQALEQAQRSVFILGWDIDSRLHLTGNGERDGYPIALGEFLDDLVSRRSELHVRVLVWDFAMIYALEREWLPVYKLGWSTHRHLHFRMDARHPPGGSQHQKMVVIDDAVAFVGGMDLAKWRWDTPEHRPLDPRRRGPEGQLYPPYHDVQCVLAGPAATALGDLARERWERVTRERLRPVASSTTPWPPKVEPEFTDVDVAIARTFPPYQHWPEVREVERLYEVSIAAARQTIYIENQYFTSRHLATVLAERLTDEHGPEVILVLPKRSNGWLEQATMDVLRARALRTLHAADRHGHLAVYYPDHPEVIPDYINVHDKIMVVDAALMRIGSANLSNRSMGLDSECDVAIEAAGDPARAASIAGFRNRLLAEHLEVAPEDVAEAFAREGSLIRAIESLRSPGRSLVPLDTQTVPTAESWLPDTELADPERPIEPEALIGRLVTEEERKPARRHLLRNATVLGLLIVIVGTWQLTPLREGISLNELLGAMDALRTLPAAPILIIGGYVAAGLLAIPLNLLVVVTVLAFGPWAGFGYSMVGALLSAFATYGLGHALGRDLVRRYAGQRLNRLSMRLARRGLIAMVVVRILPIAPFSVVNVVAGASHIRFRDFAMGTFLGLLPGLVAVTVFVDRAAASLREPHPVNYVMLALVAVAIAFAIFGLRHLLRREAAAAEGDAQG